MTQRPGREPDRPQRARTIPLGSVAAAATQVAESAELDLERALIGEARAPAWV